MLKLAPALQTLLKSLPPHADQETLNKLIEKAIHDSKNLTTSEHKKVQWEYLLKNEIFLLAATEGKALQDEGTKYYDDLRDKLDLVLAFTEHEACEQIFPFIVLQDLLETQTIASCSHIFSWIEARAERLTDGMVPQKGKALILLRTLNDLLRRLSKMGSTTIFCGRILTFLSGVFPLGERSGVNLRGEYGPRWEGVKEMEKPKKSEKTEIKEEGIKDGQHSDGDVKMDMDQAKPELEVKRPVGAAKALEKKEEFYNTFWSLQLPFSFPPLFATPNTLPEFKEAVNKVFPVIKEATAKDRAMMGSRSSAGTGLKRKREPDTDETNTNEYFFAKLLTSPELLDLEIADTHFRRQFIFQLLILLHHLLTFTKSAKATWSSSRNRSLQIDFTLDTTDAQWVQETINKATEELRQTTPNGRAFAETVNAILDREKNWIKWKNELCAPFDKEAWSAEVNGTKVNMEVATRDAREKMRIDPKDWPWKLGSEPLTEIWEMGYRDLSELQNPFQPGEVKDFWKKIKQEDSRIALRKKYLEKTAERAATRARTSLAAATATVPTEAEFPKSQDTTPDATLAPTRPAASSTSLSSNIPASLHPSLPPKPGAVSPPKQVSSSQESSSVVTPPLPTQTTVLPPPAPAPPPMIPAPVSAVAVPRDEQISKFEENKQRWSWLALRTARDQHLQHFGRIGTGNIGALAEEIEKENKEREKTNASSATGTDLAGSPVVTACGVPPLDVEAGKSVDIKTENVAADGEGDVKMEER